MFSSFLTNLRRAVGATPVSHNSRNQFGSGLKWLNNVTKALHELKNLSPDNSSNNGQCIERCKAILGDDAWRFFSENHNTALSYMWIDQRLVTQLKNKLQQYIIYALQNCETKNLDQIKIDFSVPSGLFISGNYFDAETTNFSNEASRLFLDLYNRRVLHRLAGVTLFDLELLNGDIDDDIIFRSGTNSITVREGGNAVGAGADSSLQAYNDFLNQMPRFPSSTDEIRIESLINVSARFSDLHNASLVNNAEVSNTINTNINQNPIRQITQSYLQHEYNKGITNIINTNTNENSISIRRCLVDLQNYANIGVTNVDTRNTITDILSQMPAVDEQSVISISEGTEPPWSTVMLQLDPDEQNRIARQYGYTDFYQMTSIQNNNSNLEQAARSCQNMIDHVGNSTLSTDEILIMNQKIESAMQLPGKKLYLRDKQQIDFSEVKDIITLDYFKATDQHEWCAILNGKISENISIYVLITKESLLDMLKSGNIKNPLTNKLLQTDDILNSKQLMKWLNEAIAQL